MSKKGHVLGSKPAKDPWADVEGSGMSVTSTTRIRWFDRKVRQSWTLPLLTTIFVFVGVFTVPWLVIGLSICFIIIIGITPRSIDSKKLQGDNSSWRSVPQADITLIEQKKLVECKGSGRFFISGLYLKVAPPDLPNDLASLIRAIPMSVGFCLRISLKYADPKILLEGRILEESTEKYLRHFDSPKSYMSWNRGLWKTKVTITGLLENESDRPFFESSVKGALPSKRWKRIKPSLLKHTITSVQSELQPSGFYTAGGEVSEWLVQLRSELSAEVGTNIPGQFIPDIRPRLADYALGSVLNPDTLQTGPSTGFTHQELSEGVLVCGNTWVERKRVLMLLIKQLIAADKRVILVTNRPEALEFTGLTDDAIGMTLGKDLVLNPVDPERVHRTAYVPQLMMALETLTEDNLSSSADIDNALGQVVALPNATIADVQFEMDESLTTDVASTTLPVARIKETILGMEAIRRLQYGIGARAFYGMQTVTTEKLSELSLGVVVISLGDAPLEIFAWDTLLIKLAGLKEDKDLVIVLDEPENLRVMNRRRKQRDEWAERLLRPIAHKFALVVSIDTPSVLCDGVKKLMSSCVALRLRNERDIASISSMLGLNTIGTMHTKARWSPRETSYLRSISDGKALIVYNTVDTCQPVILNDAPALLTPSSEDLSTRLSSIKKEEVTLDKSSTLLIDTVAGRDGELTRKVLKLLERYEPLTEEAVRKFILAAGNNDGDVEGVIIRLRESGMILEGHEAHSGVSYKNYRLTMKGSMALRQEILVEGAA